MTKGQSVTKRLIAVGLCGASLLLSGAWGALPVPKEPSREQVTFEGTAYEVVYLPRASERDLRLPFYPKARLVRAFLHRATLQGKPLAVLSEARFATQGAFSAIVRFYESKLPGHPKPEITRTLQMEVAKFATGDRKEVGLVKIVSRPGRREREILLTRALKPVLPAKRKLPKAAAPKPHEHAH